MDLISFVDYLPSLTREITFVTLCLLSCTPTPSNSHPPTPQPPPSQKRDQILKVRICPIGEQSIFFYNRSWGVKFFFENKYPFLERRQYHLTKLHRLKIYIFPLKWWQAQTSESTAYYVPACYELAQMNLNVLANAFNLGLLVWNVLMFINMPWNVQYHGLLNWLSSYIKILLLS